MNIDSSGSAESDGAPAPVAVPAEEHHRRIRVGAGGTLIVPREDLGMLDGSGPDLDFSAAQLAPIRRPGRTEWVALAPSRSLETRLLPWATGPRGMDKEYYWVAPHLRTPIREDIRDVLVVPFQSVLYQSPGLWVIGVNEGNPWYDSVVPALRQEPQFYDQHVFRVLSDRASGKYRVKYKPAPVKALFRWSDRPTEELLGEAIGPDRFITDNNHPIYRELIEGESLV